MPTSTVRMPSLVAVIGPIVDPQGTALLETKLLVLDARAPCCRAPFGGAERVGGVALVRVDLEQRPAVDQGPIRRVVPLGVVRVHGVAGVGREAPARGKSPRPRDRIGLDATQYVFEE